MQCAIKHSSIGQSGHHNALASGAFWLPILEFRDSGLIFLEPAGVAGGIIGDWARRSVVPIDVFLQTAHWQVA